MSKLKYHDGVGWKQIAPNMEEFDTIKEDLVAHKADIANKHIHSSGSNANGKYIKFDDGTMMCYLETRDVFGTLQGGLNTSVWVYPASFISSPMVNVSAITENPAIFYEDVFLPTTLQTTIKLHLIGVRGSYMSCRLFAIGRWKA